MLPTIIFGSAILISWWAINAFIATLSDAIVYKKRNSTSANVCLILLDIIACILWAIYHYLTH